jgi:hypothetical protein
MAKFDSETIARWTKMADAWLDSNPFGVIDRDKVLIGANAWRVAHQSGISEEAYSDRSVVDAHIVTALKQVFPNAEFKDTYSY